jgi:hypothetical protein
MYGTIRHAGYIANGMKFVPRSGDSVANGHQVTQKAYSISV